MRGTMGKTVEEVVTHLRSVIERAKKTCLVCGKRSPRTASTCPACGDASWGPLADMGVPHQKDALHTRSEGAKKTTLDSLNAFAAAANAVDGATAHVNGDVQGTTIAGRDATVFARLFLSDPRRISSDAAGVTIMFATCLNSASTDGFIVGSLIVSSAQFAEAWPLRWIRFGNVSGDAVTEIIDALLGEAFYEAF